MVPYKTYILGVPSTLFTTYFGRYLSQLSSLPDAAAVLPLTALVALKAAAAAAGNSLGILSNTPAVGEATEGGIG